MYVFKFQLGTLRGLLVLILVGLAEVVIFLAGMAAGVQWSLSSPTVEALLQEDAEAPGGQSSAEATTPRVADIRRPTIDRGVPSSVTVPVSTSVTVPSASVSTAALPSVRGDLAALTGPPPSSPEAAATEAEPAGAAEGATPARSVHGASHFAVQVGAYLFEENSAMMLAELKDRGYDPYVVKKSGSDHRVLQTVRFGRDMTRQDALQAAEEFTDREGFEAAIVRQPGEL